METQIFAPRKAPTGIAGFDEISGGGLPQSRTTLLIGGPGSGKTIFALNTLVNGARIYGEPGIFIAFEENTRQIFENSSSFGWDLPELVARNLFFIDARMSVSAVLSGEFDLQGLLAGVEAKARELSALAGGKPVRIVFDAADVLLASLHNPQSEREELYRIHDWLATNGFLGIITAKVHQGRGGPPDQDYLQFMADCVIELKRVVRESVSHRTLTIIKYRGSSFAESEFNVVIGDDGIEVPSLSIFNLNYPVSTERVSTGIPRLDEMMAGGYMRGTSILITGSPGTAKSTLAGAFVNHACQQGENALFISFDEGPEEIIRNLASVGMNLRQHVEKGLLHIYASRAESRSAVEHLVEIKRMIRRHNPLYMVIDPLSSMEKAGGEQLAKSMAQRLIYETKAQGITLLMTSLLSTANPETEATPIEISTIADSWIHLSYVVQSGERNRALTIIKSRGTGHSNQVRELVLSNNGIDLTSVYTAGGEVLMGTLRFEKESQQREENLRNQQEQSRRRQELERKIIETNARLGSLESEVKTAKAELGWLDSETSRREEQRAEQVEQVGRLRQGKSADESSQVEEENPE